MRYGNLSNIIENLEERELKKETAFFVSAQQKADEAYQKIFDEGVARLEQRKSRYRRKLNAEKRQEMIRISMSEQLRVNEFRQKLIDQELEKCVQYFHDLPDEIFFDWMSRFLGQHDEHPVIFIGPSRFESARSRFGHEYDIRLKEELKIGFLLCYKTFDINYDMNQVMRYRKQEMTNQMMDYLFEDEHDEKK
ncbi:hypothetical protein ACWN8V_03670 [Vagococcus elongatus]|uniref:Uncharacterized protein n=1 Tax=Vagococcus elongatus TaxID=180344 RepID=A0A430AZN8_9ENTE|nr:hypothetical protein [Vagococcus elongatus]RSU13524.1 hypothetical protein CBF29_04530 [Vagococcus elongatus]